MSGKWGMTLVATTSLAAVVLLVTGWGTAVAAQIDQVFVTNTTASPIPVAPQGTADVRVANDAASAVPVRQQGTTDVNITNTAVPVASQGTADVKVANDAASAIPVQPQGTTDVNITNTAVPVAPQGTADVKVANDAASAVPVRPQGTTDVNITNTAVPVTPQGTADVNITNTAVPVELEESPAAPVSTREAPSLWGDAAFLTPAAGTTECETVSIATGRKVRVETALVSVHSTAEPTVWLRVWAQYAPGLGTAVDMVMPLFDRTTTSYFNWTGQLLTGFPVVGGTSTSAAGGVPTDMSVCARAAAAEAADARVAVTGVYLDD